MLLYIEMIKSRHCGYWNYHTYQVLLTLCDIIMFNPAWALNKWFDQLERFHCNCVPWDPIYLLIISFPYQTGAACCGGGNHLGTSRNLCCSRKHDTGSGRPEESNITSLSFLPTRKRFIVCSPLTTSTDWLHQRSRQIRANLLAGKKGQKRTTAWILWSLCGL